VEARSQVTIRAAARRWGAAAIAIALGGFMLARSASARADTISNLLQPAEPSHLTLTLFAAGYGNESYGVTHEGFELEQSITRGIGVVLRLGNYQIYQGTGYDTPFNGRPGAPFFFGRFEGGVDLTPIEGTHLAVLGGHDVGDSHSAVIEESFSSWINIHSAHPINFSINSSQYFQNNLCNGLIDLRTVLLSTGELIVLAGAGATVWGGNGPGPANVQGGPDLGFFYRPWKIRLDIQGGYGSDNEYGLVAFSRSFDWQE